MQLFEHILKLCTPHHTSLVLWPLLKRFYDIIPLFLLFNWFQRTSLNKPVYFIYFNFQQKQFIVIYAIFTVLYTKYSSIHLNRYNPKYSQKHRPKISTQKIRP